MRHLIVNADDFGLTEAVSDGILEAHIGGIVTSTSLMVERDASEYAAALAHEHPRLSVGLHFVDDTPELDDPAHAARGFAAQLSRFRELMRREPTHVDSHHHVHFERMSTFVGLVESLGVPLRGDGRVRYLGEFFAHPAPGVTDLERISEPFLLRVLGRIAPDQAYAELGCHPGRVSADLRSSYGHEREIELEVLTDPELPGKIRALGFTLTGYEDWGAEDY